MPHACKQGLCIKGVVVHNMGWFDDEEDATIYHSGPIKVFRGNAVYGTCWARYHFVLRRDRLQVHASFRVNLFARARASMLMHHSLT